jgi:hypothetical protein
MGNNSSLPINLLKRLSDRLLEVDTNKQVEDFEPTCPFGHWRSNHNDNTINESTLFEELRGSPRLVLGRARGNLVGRGIANPMSERTRGFEILFSLSCRREGNRTKFPLPALLSLAIFTNVLNITIRICNHTPLILFDKLLVFPRSGSDSNWVSTAECVLEIEANTEIEYIILVVVTFLLGKKGVSCLLLAISR